MGLNLNEFVADDTEITGLNGEKFIVTAKISREQYDAFGAASMDLANMNSDKPDSGRIKSLFNKARACAIDMLAIKNERDAVKKFIDALPDNLFAKVFQFIGEHMVKQADEKKNKTEELSGTVERI